MTQEELISILPLMSGPLKDVMARLEKYKDLDRITIQGIRKTLGYTSGSNIKLTKECRDQMIAEYKNGDISIRKLAKKYGINFSALASILKRRKVAVQKDSFWNTYKVKELEYYRKKGYSFREIGKIMGLCGSAVAQKYYRLQRAKEREAKEKEFV